MIVISRHIAIPDGEFEIAAIRAQGAGRQHANKTPTAIHLRFDTQASNLPEYYKGCLLAANHHSISSDGAVVIKAQEYRSQELNREAALARLVVVVRGLATEQKAQRPTRPTRASEEHRSTLKAQKSNARTMRGKVRNGRE